jgi:hypothetical protein
MNVEISDDLIKELKGEPRLCPIICPQGQTAEGDHCIAAKARPEKAKAVEKKRPAKEEPKQASKPQRPPAQRVEASRPARQQEAAPATRRASGSSVNSGVGF